MATVIMTHFTCLVRSTIYALSYCRIIFSHQRKDHKCQLAIVARISKIQLLLNDNRDGEVSRIPPKYSCILKELAKCFIEQLCFRSSTFGRIFDAHPQMSAAKRTPRNFYNARRDATRRCLNLTSVNAALCS